MRQVMPEEDYLAGTEEWKAFMTTKIWHDIQLFLVDRIELNRDLLEMKPEERSKEQTDSELRGENQLARLMLEVPDLILKDIEESMKERQNVD